MVTVDGRRVSVSHPDRVLYPAREGSAAVTKSEVIDYYRAVALTILPHIHSRPVTRKRWPRGVDESSFFEKNLPSSAPSWIPRSTLVHRDHENVYPLVDSEATLAWLGQQAALELHVPQWRTDLPNPDAEVPGSPTAHLADRIVFDLDPGPDAGLPDCAEVALKVRDLLEDNGLRCFPVTSGSKGIHLYIPLGRPTVPADASHAARRVADELAERHPRLVTATMRKADRRGKVFIDWSQNNGNKTTVSPYSLRGRERPTVAAPRTWDEISSGDLQQLTYDEVLKRLRKSGDLLADMTTQPDEAASDFGDADGVDRLGQYRRRRHRGRTPEPVPDARREDTDGDNTDGDHTDEENLTFVIQEHHARSLHWDFRLERDDVLVSWAVPKNLPGTPDQNRLAVRTEDHPLEYATFEGTIPRGEYGAGDVEIWDAGTYEKIKWQDDEVIVDLHGDRVHGRYALIRTGKKGEGGGSGSNWLAHLMKDQPDDDGGPSESRLPDGSAPLAAAGRRRGAGGGDVQPFPHGIDPMLATPGSIDGLSPDRWAFEGKWDGYRILIEVHEGELTLRSRSGRDVTADFPGFAGLAEELSGHDVVLDAELVALDDKSVPDFAALQHRNSRTDLRLYAFDALYVDGRSLLRTRYRDRRRVLEALAPLMRSAEVPGTFEGGPSAALQRSKDDGLEGVVAKKRDARYRPGARTDTWIKHKHWASDEVVIGGFTAGSGSRASTFGALLLGLPDEGALHYIGKVGTGFSEATLEELSKKMQRYRRKTSPFADDVPRADTHDPQWVRPILVGEVRHSGRTEEGRFRHPAWRGLRPIRQTEVRHPVSAN